MHFCSLFSTRSAVSWLFWVRDWQVGKKSEMPVAWGGARGGCQAGLSRNVNFDCRPDHPSCSLGVSTHSSAFSNEITTSQDSNFHFLNKPVMCSSRPRGAQYNPYFFSTTRNALSAKLRVFYPPSLRGRADCVEEYRKVRNRPIDAF